MTDATEARLEQIVTLSRAVETHVGDRIRDLAERALADERALAPRALCEDCDHGVRGGLPCASCGGTGFVLTDIEQGFWTRAQQAEQRVEQLKGTVSQLGDAFWLAEQTRLHDELTKVTTRQHDWEFYANGSFCRRCGAQIGSGLPCR